MHKKLTLPPFAVSFSVGGRGDGGSLNITLGFVLISLDFFVSDGNCRHPAQNV